MWTSLDQQLIDAIARWDESSIRSLIAQGADLNKIHPNEYESLFTMAFSQLDDQSEDMMSQVATLIDLGANPDAGDARGLSSLVYAIWNLDLPLLTLLLENSANPNRILGIDEIPETALDFVFNEYYCDPDEAAERVLQEMEALLRRHGGKTYDELSVPEAESGPSH